jgi:integrase
MFNDARSKKAGRLMRAANPFAGLGLETRKGNAEKAPPSEALVWTLVERARALSGVYFSAWLAVAAFTGCRPGELDALRWTCVDFEAGRLRIAEQFNSTTRTFTLPKNGKRRDAILTPPARDALLALPRSGEFVFVNLRGEHWSPSSRAYHWRSVRAAAGWDGSLYLATRHFAGWYMTNFLELPSEDVAIALGHTDGGDLVRRLYGHRDHARALDRVAQAYARKAGAKGARRLRAIDGGAA